ncbi:MAG: hypothetical protein KDE27_32240, partial [Planctomycetes bacterium]|nr:hypothetical protein [Planctomycetota bacterium]
KTPVSEPTAGDADDDVAADVGSVDAASFDAPRRTDGVGDDDEDLFPDPVLPPGAGDGAESSGEPDVDDMLFEDHSRRVEPSESFAAAAGRDFDEEGASGWDGEQLELEERATELEERIVDTGSGIPLDDEAGTPVELGVDADSIVHSAAAFNAQLDSLLDEEVEDEDDFGLDSDRELEIVGGGDTASIMLPSNDDLAAAASEEDLEADEAFVLADGESEWGDAEGAAELAPEAPVYGYDAPATDDVAADEPADEQFVVAEAGEYSDLASEGEGDEAAASEYIGGLSAAASAEADATEEGWEPLPGTKMDELAEVEGVAPVEEESYEPVGARQHQLAAVGSAEDHDDLYAEADDEPEVVGGYQERHRVVGILTAAAALLIVGLGALVAVLRPEWLGLHFEPERVEIVQIGRPAVKVEVAQPPMPVAAVEGPRVVVDEPPVPGPDENPETPVTTPDDPLAAGETPTDPSDPATGTGSGDPTDPTDPTDPGTAATDPVAVGGTDPVATPDEPVTPDEPTSEDPPVAPIAVPSGPEAWPVAVTPVTGGEPAAGVGRAPELLRVGDDLLVGSNTILPPRLAAEGVMPGSRAFAQLVNGNYFIGAVKAVDSEFITLRVAEGEVSLRRDMIVRLTGLGSADYDELQRATSGFVRLTNNNRLVGGILESIADDHVILQTRSNRVMLPKSVVGEIIRTSGSESDVRIGTTTEEDDWLRRLSEQQLREADVRATIPTATPRPDGGER